jgi:putative flippase GtrA
MSRLAARSAAVDGTLPGSIIAFGVVGTSAALVHLIVVSLLVPVGLHPLAANVAGFLSAFAVSFRGHRRWSFPQAHSARPRALRRFFIVAIAAFAMNELLYGILLQTTSLDYRATLVVVLSVVAVSTFVASRHWAFSDD